MEAASWLLLGVGFAAGALVAFAAITLLLWLHIRTMDTELATETIAASVARPPSPVTVPGGFRRTPSSDWSGTPNSDPYVPSSSWSPDPRFPPYQSGIAQRSDLGRSEHRSAWKDPHDRTIYDPYD